MDKVQLGNGDNFANYASEDVRGAINEVKHDFDPGAALNLIRYFHYQFEVGELFANKRLSEKERAFIDYTSHAFSRIASAGKSADVAFGLCLGKGEYSRDSTIYRDVRIVAFVVLSMRRNWTWIDAKEEATNEFFPDGGGDGAVNLAYTRYQYAVRRWQNADLEEILNGTQVIRTR